MGIKGNPWHTCNCLQVYFGHVLFSPFHMRKPFHPVSNSPMQTQLGYIQVLKKKKKKNSLN